MNCTRPLLALALGGALLATATAVADPSQASAAPSSARASTATSSSHASQPGDDDSSTEAIRISRSGSLVTLDIDAPATTSIVLTDETGFRVAGTTSRNGAARIAVPAPSTRQVLTVTGTRDGTSTEIGTATIGGASDSSANARTVNGTFDDGVHAGLRVSGRPGAAVTVRDGGRLIGSRVLGSSGVATVLIAAEPEADRHLSITQKTGGSTSEAAEVDFLAPPRVDVERTGTDAAVVTFHTLEGTAWPLAVEDSRGRVIAGGRFDDSGRTSRTIRWTPGSSQTFTVFRGDTGAAWRSHTTFTIDSAAAAPVEQPTVRFTGPGLTRIEGEPNLLFTVRTADAESRTVLVDQLSSTGGYVDAARRLTPGTKYVVTLSLGSDTSAPTPFTPPAS